MAKTTATAVEISSRFSFTGTIEKIETFNSKGGGLKLIVQTSESERLLDLFNAKGNVIVFDAGVFLQEVSNVFNVQASFAFSWCFKDFAHSPFFRSGA